MKRLLALMVVAAIASGCTAPVTSAPRVSSTASASTQPGASPGSLKPITSDALPTNQAGIESNVRQLLADSQISTIQSQLTTVGALSDVERHNATTAGLTTDSPVWRVTVTGNLKPPHGAGIGLGGQSITSKTMFLVFSAEDGRTLSWGMADPSFGSPPAS